jgi:hypothetical protein
MCRGYDHQAKAVEAMKLAGAATCEIDRLRWLRVALAWRELARTNAEKPDDRRG